jgi:hypothetical protein
MNIEVTIMNNAKAIEKESLNDFRNYLLRTVKLAESTSSDYCKRILTICKEEGIEITDLSDKIETLCYDYTEGSKKELGARSHNSYRSAIISFKNYIVWARNNQSKTDKQFLVHMCLSKIKKNLIGYAELTDTSTDQVLDTRIFTKSEITNGSSEKNTYKIVWDLAFEAIFKEKGIQEIKSILSSQNVGFEIENEITKTTHKII